MKVEVVQYQNILLIVYVSCWWTIFLLSPSSTIYSLHHFKTCERKSALRSFEIKLFENASTRKWVCHPSSFWNKLLYHCFLLLFCGFFLWVLVIFCLMLALKQKKNLIILPEYFRLHGCEESKSQRFTIFFTLDTHFGLIWHFSLLSSEIECLGRFG